MSGIGSETEADEHALLVLPLKRDIRPTRTATLSWKKSLQYRGRVPSDR